MIFLPIMTQHTRHIKPEHMSGPQPLHMQIVETEVDLPNELEPESTDEDTEHNWKLALIRTEMRLRQAGRGPSRPESGI